MPWIEEAGTPELPAIFQVMSLNSSALEAVEQLNERLAFGLSTLDRVQEEAIATAVSVANRSRYGALTHGGFLLRYSGDPTLASQILSDYTRADLTLKDRCMLDFAVRVTLEPGTLSEGDIDGLRAAGFDDRDILSIVMVTCLFNFMNRVANSLGVEVDPGFQRAVQSWLEGPSAQKTWLFYPPGELDSDTVGKETVVPSGVSRWPALPAENSLQRVSTVKTTEKQTFSQGGAAQQGPVLQAPAGQRSNHVALPEESPMGDPAQSDISRAKPPRGSTAHKDSSEESLPEESNTMIDDVAHEPQRIHSLPRFLEDCCNVSSSDSATARDLYIAYLRWCDENHWGPLLQRNFGLGLTDLGFRRHRRGQGRHWWLGIGLKSGVVED